MHEEPPPDAFPTLSQRHSLARNDLGPNHPSSRVFWVAEAMTTRLEALGDIHLSRYGSWGLQ